MCIRDRLERPTPTSEWYLRAPCVQERPTGTVREADRRVCRWLPPPGDYRLRHPGASAEGRLSQSAIVRPPESAIVPPEAGGRQSRSSSLGRRAGRTLGACQGSPVSYTHLRAHETVLD